jgi:hypothetical protein
MGGFYIFDDVPFYPYTQRLFVGVAACPTQLSALEYLKGEGVKALFTNRTNTPSPISKSLAPAHALLAGANRLLAPKEQVIPLPSALCSVVEERGLIIPPRSRNSQPTVRQAG